MELRVRTQGRYDELEILFFEEIDERVGGLLEAAAARIRGVESAAANRYSVALVLAPHVATVSDVADEFEKLLDDPRLRGPLRESGVTGITVSRREGDREYSAPSRGDIRDSELL